MTKDRVLLKGHTIHDLNIAVLGTRSSVSIVLLHVHSSNCKCVNVSCQWDVKKVYLKNTEQPEQTKTEQSFGASFASVSCRLKMHGVM